MSTPAPASWSSFTGPRYWPMWLGIAALCICAWLPFRLRMLAGKLLGLATYAVGHERRYITAVNIALCFPELDARAQHALVRQSFIDNGIGLIETATGWMRPAGHFRKQLIMRGTEHLDAALALGRGVMMLGAHYSTLDFGANLLAATYPFAVTYRPHSNALFDAFMLRGRISNCNGVFDRNDIRGMYRHLKQNRILWYAPDQDYGPEQAVYAPFFGHPAATLSAASRISAFNQSPIVFVRQHRDTANRCYLLEFTPLSPPLPTGDVLLDATAINAAVEHAIRQEPSQYLWMHKRFKTQPGGKPASPYIHIKTPYKKLTAAQYDGLRAGATSHAVTALPQLASGVVLREFTGLPHALMKQRHPAMQLDRLSKELRSHGIRTLTVDNIFRIPTRGVTAVTCFMPEGDAHAATKASTPMIAAFFAQLHNSGFHCVEIHAGTIAATDRELFVPDPLQVRQVPGSASHSQRLRDLVAWNALRGGKAESLDELLTEYVPLVRRMDAASFTQWLAHHPMPADNAA